MQETFLSSSSSFLHEGENKGKNIGGDQRELRDQEREKLRGKIGVGQGEEQGDGQGEEQREGQGGQEIVGLNQGVRNGEEGNRREVGEVGEGRQCARWMEIAHLNRERIQREYPPGGPKKMIGEGENDRDLRDVKYTRVEEWVWKKRNGEVGQCAKICFKLLEIMTKRYCSNQQNDLQRQVFNLQNVYIATFSKQEETNLDIFKTEIKICERPVTLSPTPRSLQQNLALFFHKIFVPEIPLQSIWKKFVQSQEIILSKKIPKVFRQAIRICLSSRPFSLKTLIEYFCCFLIENKEMILNEWKFTEEQQNKIRNSLMKSLEEIAHLIFIEKMKLKCRKSLQSLMQVVKGFQRGFERSQGSQLQNIAAILYHACKKILKIVFELYYLQTYRKILQDPPRILREYSWNSWNKIQVNLKQIMSYEQYTGIKKKSIFYKNYLIKKGKFTKQFKGFAQRMISLMVEIIEQKYR